MNKKELELYIHIPFCVRKCSYCDFLSAPATEQTREAYMAALFAEIGGRAKDYSDRTVTSIFIGGGTPSLLSGEQIGQLMDRIREQFAMAQDAEITMEVNPGQVYREAVEAGFTNINVDIMSGLPGQTLASYRDTLEKVLHLEPMPQHISAYSLIVEEGTPFAAMAERGELPLPEEETERAMYEETIEVLAKYGFHRYEISNYARDGYECRHNVGYWIRRDYLGFGIGAASLIDNVRFQNEKSLGAYLAHPLESREEEQTLTVQDRMEETMFLGLRLTRGVSCVDFAEQYGRTVEEVYGEVIARNVADGLLTVTERKENQKKDRFLALTKRGLDLSNYVMAQFLF